MRDATRKPAPPRPARGAQPGNANARQHGVYSLQRRLKSAGLAKLDGRSALERLKRDWKDDVRTALGGDLAPQKEALLELAANTWLMASSADDFILERGAINRRRGALRPIVEQRAKLVRTLRELLTAIGLERAEPPGETLRDVVARYERGDPMGSPGLLAPGRSVPHRNRRNAGKPDATPAGGGSASTVATVADRRSASPAGATEGDGCESLPSHAAARPSHPAGDGSPATAHHAGPGEGTDAMDETREGATERDADPRETVDTTDETRDAAARRDHDKEELTP